MDFRMKKIQIVAALLMAACMLTVSAAAAEFVPSVTAKEAPSVSTAVDSEGNTLDAGAITVTSYSDLSSADKDVRRSMATAMADVEEADSIADLAADFEEVWTEATNGAPVEEAVVSDFFDISATDEINAIFAAGGKVTLTLPLPNISADAVVIVLHKVGDEWIVEKDVARNADGSLSITVGSLSPFALVVGAAEAVEENPEAPKSPETSDSMVWATVSLAGAAIAVLAVSKKKKNA